MEIRSGGKRHTSRPREKVNLLDFLFLADKQNVSLEQVKVKFVVFRDLEKEPATSRGYSLKWSVFHYLYPSSA